MSDEQANSQARPGHDGYDPEKCQSYVERILSLHDDLDRIAAERMAESKGVREDIKEVLGEAKDDGIPKKALKAVVKTKLLERKIEAVRDGLDEAQDDYDLIRHALGDLADLPLGRHVLGDDDGQTDLEEAVAAANTAPDFPEPPAPAA